MSVVASVHQHAIPAIYNLQSTSLPFADLPRRFGQMPNQTPITGWIQPSQCQQPLVQRREGGKVPDHLVL